jgi:hypothetical protein
MNLLFQSLYLLFRPRLPRLGREDVAGIAEYYNRLARRQEATMDPPGVWRGRISMRLEVPVLPFKSTEKVPREILLRIGRVLRRDLLENNWGIVLQK